MADPRGQRCVRARGRAIRARRLIEGYIADLEAELADRGIRDPRIVREVRAHLRESVRRHAREAGDRAEAERLAVVRFGPACDVAAAFAVEQTSRPLAHRTPPSRALRVVVALAGALVLAGSGTVFGSVFLDKPVLGILWSEESTNRPGGSRGVLYSPPAGRLVNVNPRTLRPLSGRSLSLGTRWRPLTASPERSRLVLAPTRGATIRFVDLSALKTLGEVQLVPGRHRSVRAGAWVDGRLLALTQRMGGPYRRQVRGRSLVAVDPTSRRVVARRSFSTAAVQGSATAGGVWVLELGDSDNRRPYVELAIARADASFRTVRIAVGRISPNGARVPTALTLEPSGRRAFVTTWSGRTFEVDLDSLRISVHSSRFRAANVEPPSAIALPAAAVRDRYVALAGLLRFSRGRASSVGGVWLLDTRSWVARPLDRSGNQFEHGRDTLLVYGAAINSKRVHGVGVRAYDASGRRLYHLYPGRQIQRPVIVGSYLHTLVSPSRHPRSVFDVRTGRNLGRISHPPQNLSLLDDRAAW